MPLILLLFSLLSGAAALMYEIAWVKLLSHVFGNTTHAISLVLASFMLGLGIGGVVMGWRLDRKPGPVLRAYGLLEIAIGLCGAAFPFAARAVETLYVQWLRSDAAPSAASAEWLRAGLIFLLVAIPAGFMGATFPVLCKAAIPRARAASSGVGLLYGANTLGAFLGAMASGFWLMALLGVAGSTYAAVAINLTIGFLAVTIDSVTVYGWDEEDAPAPPARWRLLGVCAIFAAAGFGNMALEVAWSRALGFFLRSHIYAVTTVIAVFLAGTALGSLCFGRLARHTRWRLVWLGLTFIGIGGCGMMFLHAPWGLDGLYSLLSKTQIWFDQTTHAGFAASLLLLSGAVVLAPTFLMGMQFPLIAAVAIRDAASVGSRIGFLYLCNTLGAVAGSLAAGFYLIPRFGLQPSLAGLAWGSLGVGALILLLQRETGWIARAVLLLSSLGALSPWLFAAGPFEPMILKSKVFRDPDFGPRRTLLSYEEDAAFGVSVVDDAAAESRTIYTDNFAAALTHRNAKYMRMLGHLPMLMHPRPREALVVCLGTGTTAGSVGAYAPERLDVVDISPAVVRACERYFDDMNQGVLREPFCHVSIDDGRNFILTSRRSWDVISLEPLLPYTPAAIDLYTWDFYAICRQRLKPGGIMCQWLPVHAMSLDNFRMTLRAFTAAFPYASLWFFDQSAVVLGAEEPILADMDRLARELAGKPGENLRDVELCDASAILMSYVSGGEALREYCNDVPLLTDERPVIEFTELSPPRAAFETAVMEDFKELKKKSSVLDILRREAPLDAETVNRWQAWQQAAVLTYAGRIHLLAQDWGRAREKFAAALEFAPADPVARGLFRQAGYRYHATVAEHALAAREWLTAIANLEEAIAYQPDQPDAHFRLGEVLLSLGGGSEERGVAELRQAAALDPRYAAARFRLADYHFNRGEWRQAGDYLKQGLTLRPDVRAMEGVRKMTEELARQGVSVTSE